MSSDHLADVAAPAPAPPRAAPHDTRSSWRLLLAVIAPLPMLAQGIYYLLAPVDGGADFAATVAAFRDHRGIADAIFWLNVVFCVGLIPATIAVAWVARRGAPRLARAGGVVALGGFLAGFTLLGGPQTPALTTVQNGLDQAAMAAYDQALQDKPVTQLAGLLFIVGVVIGLGLLGAALWRSRAVPAWAGIALLVGGVTHPFMPGHVAAGIGLLVAAVGYAGASLALLRMRNDDFDLPPVPAAS